MQSVSQRCKINVAKFPFIIVWYFGVILKEQSLGGKESASSHPRYIGLIITENSSSKKLTYYTDCGKPQEKLSPILVTLTPRSDSDLERSNVSLKENKPDSVNLD